MWICIFDFAFRGCYYSVSTLFNCMQQFPDFFLGFFMADMSAITPLNATGTLFLYIILTYTNAGNVDLSFFLQDIHCLQILRLVCVVLNWYLFYLHLLMKILKRLKGQRDIFGSSKCFKCSAIGKGQGAINICFTYHS